MWRGGVGTPICCRPFRLAVPHDAVDGIIYPKREAPAPTGCI
jgi:hypothetical protein